jgi:signal transduction histidine kinase
MSLLTTVADQVAVAVENVKLYDRAQDVAALEERARLARELHDSVTQALFSMTLRARAVQLRLEREGIEADSPAARDLRDLSELTQGALAEMRSLIFELRPGALREEGLVAALQKQTAAIGAREGIEVTVDAPDARLPLKPSVEEHLYRLAQEALHNVVKHAQAEHVLVRLEVGPEVMTMEIRDDGTGFDPAAVPPGHLGLHTMAERTGQIGGSIEVLSAVGEGTTVRVRIPCVRATGVETCRSA